MMEPAGDSSLEAAIAWLAQTILAALLMDKMEDWIRQVGLADHAERLQCEVERVEMVVAAVKGWAAGNRPLSRALARVRELLYDADDLVNELDYYRLQQQVQGELVRETSRGEAADTPNTSVGKLRSVVWEHFTITEKVYGKPVKAICRYCPSEFNCDPKRNGTSSMKKHWKKEHPLTCTKKPPGAHPSNPSSSNGEHTVLGSSSSRRGKRPRSTAWERFDVIEKENEQPMKARCKYCPAEIKCGPTSGTAGMLNHSKICKNKPGPNDHPPNPSSTSNAHADVMPITAANTFTPCDKAALSNRIQKVIGQLQYIRGEMGERLKLNGSDSTSSSDHHRSTTSDQPLGTSSLVPRKVYGRDKEKEWIVKLMMTEVRSEKVIVVPIVGIAGVGKTTLTQLVYNDPEVERQFQHRIWVSVSHNFDEMRLTREMLSFVSQESHEGIGSFVKLQEILRSHLKSKRVLLILDDVWDDKNDYRWNQLLASFKANGANGNVILVTTRKLSVAK